MLLQMETGRGSDWTQDPRDLEREDSLHMLRADMH